MLPFETLCIVVLLPIIPAYIFFKALQSTGSVGGKVLGIDIKLGGAFAGYFAVVALIIANHNSLFPAAQYQLWTVTGTVTDGNGDPIDEPLDTHNISAGPPSQAQEMGDKSGVFMLTTFACPSSDGGFVYPTLHVAPEPQKYQPEDISLDPTKAPPPGVTWDPPNGQQLSLKVRLTPIPQKYDEGLTPIVANLPGAGSGAGGSDATR